MKNRTGLVLAIVGLALCAGLVWFALSPVGAPARASDDPGTDRAEGLAASTSSLEASTTAADSARTLDVDASAGAARARVASEPPFEAEDAIWVEGRVLFPPGTPPDERAQIVAEFEHDESTKPHRASIDSDGSFRVAFPAETATGQLELSARYLFLFEPFHLDLRVPSRSVVIEPELGGFVHAIFVLPSASEERRHELVGTEVSVSAASSLRTGNAWTIALRKTPVEVASHVDIGGLIPGVAYDLRGDPSTLAPFRLRGVRVEPGSVTNVELPVESGVDLRGRVVDESAAPIAGARFELMVHNGNDSTYDESKESSAADGAFVLRGVRAGKIRLTASAAGYLATRVRLDSPADGGEHGDLQVVLKRGSSIRGRVQWRDGTPAAGAELEIDLLSSSASRDQWDALGWSDTQKHVAGADGSFDIRGLTAGPFLLVARAPSGERHGSARIDAVASDREPLLLTLDEGLAIHGRVVDEIGGVATRFTIRAAPAVRDEAMWFAESVAGQVSSADGSFVLNDLRAGTWSIAARGVGGLVRRNASVPDDGTSLELVLPRPASIAGVVLDPEGEPVRGARVSYVPATLPGAPEEQRFTANPTGADGRFAIDAVSSGPGALTATHYRFATSETETFELAPGQTLAGMVVKLRASGRLTGEALDTEGRPDSMRAVYLSPRGGRTQISASVDSDAQGHFELEGLPSGDYSLRTIASMAERDVENREAARTAATNVSKRVDVTVVAGETTHVVLGGKLRAPVRVTGQVIARGQAVAGATVSASGSTPGKRARTDEDGRYEFVLDEPAVYNFTVGFSGNGSVVTRQENVPEAAHITVDFELPGARIAGRVVTPQGQPARQIQVELKTERWADPVSNALRTAFGHMTTGDDGRFAFEHLLPGTYGLNADEAMYLGTEQVAQYSPTSVGDLVLAQDAAIDDVELKLEPAGRLEVEVVGPLGELAAGADVFTFDESGAAMQRYNGKSTDAAGRMRLSGLPLRPLFAFARKGTLASVVVGPLRVGETPLVKLELRPGTLLDLELDTPERVMTVRVSVRDEHGIDFAKVWSRRNGAVVSPAGASPGTRVGPLPPGRYHVALDEDDFKKPGIDVLVSGEPSRTVTLPMLPGPTRND